MLEEKEEEEEVEQEDTTFKTVLVQHSVIHPLLADVVGAEEMPATSGQASRVSNAAKGLFPCPAPLLTQRLA